MKLLQRLKKRSLKAEGEQGMAMAVAMLMGLMRRLSKRYSRGCRTSVSLHGSPRSKELLVEAKDA